MHKQLKRERKNKIGSNKQRKMSNRKKCQNWDKIYSTRVNDSVMLRKLGNRLQINDAILG